MLGGLHNYVSVTAEQRHSLEIRVTPLNDHQWPENELGTSTTCFNCIKQMSHFIMKIKAAAS